MSRTVVISLFSPDQRGLVAAVTGRLFDLGCNLADTSFAVLGEGAEFTGLAEVPAEVDPVDIESELKALPPLHKGKVEVRPFDLEAHHGPDAQATHRVEAEGIDQPGLLARLSEVFLEYDANIVRLSTERVPGPQGDVHVARFTIYVPEDRAAACLAAVANTAGSLRQKLHWEPLTRAVR